jgi:hypothetical protein
MATQPSSAPKAGVPGTLIDTHIGKLEIVNGYPSRPTLAKLYEELDFERAVQAYIWAMPIVALDALRLGYKNDLNIDYNVVNILEHYADPTAEVLTANDSTIYASAVLNLDRPLVVDSPAGAYGVIDDYWQRPIVEVGPFGPDKGRGGKFLLLPPGYEGVVPTEGYFVAASPTTRAFYVGRAFVHNGDIQSAVDELKKIRIYPLDRAANPPTTKIELTGKRPLHTIAPAGFEYWQRLAEIIQIEPVEQRDRFFHAMLKPLGIEKGKPFAPDARQRRLLTQAAIVGFRMTQAISMAPRAESAVGYPGTQWEWVLALNPNQEAKNYSQLDERADYTFEAITVAEGMVRPIVGAGSQYMKAARDKDGNWLDGGQCYALHVPPNVPAKEFWALTVYDNLTRSMIQSDTNRPGVASHDKLVVNSDGSIDAYFGPRLQPERECNSIKTIPGKGWFAYFRWYGPTEAFFDKSWKLPDIERTTQ